MEELDKHVRIELIDDMAKRKRTYKPIRSQIDSWLATRSGESVPKKLKIMVVDQTLKFMKSIKGKLEDFPYSLNVQSHFTEDFYQVKRLKPQLIVFSYDEEFNHKEQFVQLMENINSINHYKPFVLLFGYDDKDISKSFPDNKILVYPDFVYLKEVRKIAKMLDNKLHISNAKQKVFPSSHSDSSLMLVKRNVSVKSMSESTVYFESDTEIPMWTVFMVEKPVPMLLTVVPHKSDGEYKNNPRVYRALINGAGMKQKALLRKLINKALGLSK